MTSSDRTVGGAVRRRWRIPIDDSRRPELRATRILAAPMTQKRNANRKKVMICALNRVLKTPP